MTETVHAPTQRSSDQNLITESSQSPTTASTFYSLLNAVDSEFIADQFGIGTYTNKHDFDNHLKIGIFEGINPSDSLAELAEKTAIHDQLLETDSRSELSELSDRVEETKQYLRARGWRPTSTNDMDVEVMVFDGRLVVIDYEYLYHEDWMFDPLCWRWSKHLRRDTPHTATTNLEIADQDRDFRGAPAIPARRRRKIEDMHYSRIASRAAVETGRW